MSIKVYTAYKVKKPSYFWSMMPSIIERARNNVTLALVDLYKLHISNVSTSSKEYLHAIKSLKENPFVEKLSESGYELQAKIDCCYNIINSKYIKQLSSRENNLYNFDVELGIHHYNKNYYIIPYASSIMKDTLSFLKDDYRLVDFCYFNNTDKPGHISASEWNKRKKVWVKIIENWDCNLGLSICNYNNYYNLDPYITGKLKKFLSIS